VVRAIAQGRDPRSTPVADVCGRDLASVSPDEQIGGAIRLAVVEAGQLVGILSIGTSPWIETGNPPWRPSARRARASESAAAPRSPAPPVSRTAAV
jgi:hypothetical protein